MTVNISDIAKASKLAVDWVLANKDVEPDLLNKSDELITDISCLYNKAQAYANVLDNSKTIGVFGQSQAGKSYLVSRLAMGTKDSVSVKWDDIVLDFITHINPPGHGVESSAFVTRFSHNKHTTPKGFPVEFKVFKETEIVMILLNSFFNDFTPESIDFSLANIDFEAHLKACDDPKFYILNSDENPSTITVEDVVELAYYLKRSTGTVLKDFDVNHKYWLYGRTHLSKMNIAGRLFYFSILWSKFNVYGALYKKLITELNKLNGMTTIYAPTSVFVEPTTDNDSGYKARSNTIILVNALENLLTSVETVKVALNVEGQKIVELSYPALAALICEFYLSPEEISENLSTFDILDLPGARSRETNSQKELRAEDNNFDGINVRPNSLVAKTLNEKFRRGKVAFLFDRYSNKGEFEVLLYCISAANPNQEVRSLTNIVKNFINENIGTTPEARDLVSNTLVGVYTQFDVALSTQYGNLENHQPLDVGTKMKGLMELFSGEEWIKKWNKTQGFKNFYVVRNPKFAKSCAFMDIDAEGNEVGIKPQSQDALDKIVKEYCNDANIINHIQEPQKAFEALLKIGDGGVSYLADNLQRDYADCSNRTNGFIKRLSTELENVYQRLAVFANFSGEQKRAKVRNEAINTAYILLQCEVLTPILCELKEALEISFDTYVKTYNDNFNEGNNAFRYATEVMDLFKERLEALKAGSSNRHISQAVTLAFKNKKDNIFKEQCPFCFDNGVLKSEVEVNKVVSFALSQFATAVETLVNAAQLDLSNKLNLLLYENEQRSARKEELSSLQARIADDFISNFVETFGFDYLDDLTFSQYFEYVVCKGLGYIFAIKTPELRQGLPKKEIFNHGNEFIHGIAQIQNDNMKFLHQHKLDYYSNLIGVIELVSSVAQSKYCFSKEQNQLLCNILALLKN